MHRRDLESLTARLADHLIVDAYQMVTQLGELGAIALIRPGREPILFCPPHPPH
jgi:hypothetical protein